MYVGTIHSSLSIPFDLENDHNTTSIPKTDGTEHSDREVPDSPATRRELREGILNDERLQDAHHFSILHFKTLHRVVSRSTFPHVLGQPVLCSRAYTEAHRFPNKCCCIWVHPLGLDSDYCEHLNGERLDFKGNPRKKGLRPSLMVSTVNCQEVEYPSSKDRPP